ncbi:MAG: hypothetical protein HUK03_07490, partial [Bacteroidaceae bacterium]|nr:hypothetical protein [Bacteroidaceae bacterium]
MANMIPEENYRTLDTSYRSEPDIVNFCNSVFTRAFAGKLDEKKVVLKPHREKTSCGPNLINWSSPASKKEDFHKDLADFVDDFIKEYATQESDPFSHKDIAILVRNNKDVKEIADALTARGIPVNAGAGSLLEQKETELMTAILTLVIDPTNQLAKAKIAHLTTPGFDLATLTDSRLSALQDDETLQSWLNDNPLVQQVLTLRKGWLDQSVSALVESVAVELNLRAVLKSWSGTWNKRENNLYQLIDLATRYEEYCDVMTLGATVTGFLNYLQECEDTAAGDNNGVIVCTYHKAKGLQWKNVILVSLDHDFADDKKIVLHHMLGVQKVRTIEPAADNLFPEMIISLVPQVFPVSQGKVSAPDDIFNNIVNTQEYTDIRRAAIEECKRLLYVGMTRAEDKLITATKTRGKGCPDPVAWLKNLGVEVQVPGAEGEVDLCGT